MNTTIDHIIACGAIGGLIGCVMLYFALRPR